MRLESSQRRADYKSALRLRASNALIKQEKAPPRKQQLLPDALFYLDQGNLD